MREKKWRYCIISFVLIVALILPMFSTINVYAASDLYLAYQKDENGKTVVNLNAKEREKYKVTEIYLSPNDKVDLCFINASSWKNARWTSSNPNVATVDSAGIVTAVSSGVTVITLTYTKKYSLIGTKVSASATVYVGEENWGLKVESSTSATGDNYYEIKAGTNLDFNIKGIANQGKELYDIVWESSDTNIAEFSGNKLYAKNVGNVIVTAKIINKVTGICIIKNINVKVYVSTMTIQQKLDYLLEVQLGLKDGAKIYFTMNQAPCTTTRQQHKDMGNQCPNCDVSNIVKMNWFKDEFGIVDVNNFPSHDYENGTRPHTGFSCLGFACFVQWYLYADYSTENLQGERQTKITFNKENIMNCVNSGNLKPGDVIRSGGHSFVVYEVDENGVTAVDSNWDSSKLSCLVQKHTFRYDGYLAGKTAYINRVTKASEMKDGMAGIYYGNTTPIITEVPNVTVPPINEEQNQTNLPQQSNENYIYEGTLNLKKFGWSEYSTGINYDLVGGTKGILYHGARLSVIEEKINSKGNLVAYCYSWDLNEYVYVSSKYIDKTN